MPLLVTPNGRYRIGIHRIGERFTVKRMTAVERTETHPDGQIAYFDIIDHSDNSTMTIDEDDAEQLEALWQLVLTNHLTAEQVDKHLAWLFDVQCPPEHSTLS